MTGFLASVFGRTTRHIVWKLLAETVMAMLGRIDWKVVIERLVSRCISKGLRWFEESDSNSLAVGTAADVLRQLKRKDLPHIK